MGPVTLEGNVEEAPADIVTDLDVEPLHCWDCNVSFTSHRFLYDHLLHHVKQPYIVLERAKVPSLKITLKTTDNKNFQIVHSPIANDRTVAEAEEATTTTEAEAAEPEAEAPDDDAEGVSDESFCLTYDESEGDGDKEEVEEVEGAEPTPPPEQDYPKIRIKTGLLKEALTITEVTDDVSVSDAQNRTDVGEQQYSNNVWTTPSLEDPLEIPEVTQKNDKDLLSLFGSNNERAKDLGFTTSDSEFMPLDRLDDRNKNALQLYGSRAVTSGGNQNPLDNLTGLPMQQLAEQVSRLQPNSGMHQQNVLINIQQFPQAPPQPQHAYQPPPMYHHPPQPMYQPYQYQPPNPLYYPPAPGYPQHMPPPPQQPMRPPPMQPQQPRPQQQQQPQQQQYRPSHMSQRPVLTPRQPGQRAPLRQSLPPRQPMGVRQRAPLQRPRGVTPGIMRGAGLRPRLPGMQQQQQVRMVKRSPEQLGTLQAKRKRIDVLLPDKNDDPDCQVICTQPKNTDGGLPQIQSVQGGTPESTDNNVMHLSDSITLSVRNPPARPQSPKKSDAKAVANILATRGITVTATAKPKEKPTSPKRTPTPPPLVAINLNSAVSIIPASKTPQKLPTQQQQQQKQDTRLPTVDLTDENNSESTHKQTLLPPPKPPPTLPPPQKPPRSNLPFRCDLCPAQYPNLIGLTKHKQTYHKTNGGPCEIGVPLVNLRTPGVLQRLSNLGILNYIPLPGPGSDGMYGIPVVSARNPGSAAALGATSLLTLGPVRSIPRQNAGGNVSNGK